MTAGSGALALTGAAALCLATTGLTAAVVLPTTMPDTAGVVCGARDSFSDFERAFSAGREMVPISRGGTVAGSTGAGFDPESISIGLTGSAIDSAGGAV